MCVHKPATERRRDMTRLRRERQAKGWSMEYMGRALGVTRQAVHHWETGHRKPRGISARRLEAIFELPLAILLENENDDPKVAAVSCGRQNTKEHHES